MKPQPKAKPYRSKKYLLFVASHSCCMCGSRYGVVPHHSATGGMGTKCSDDLCVPLCFRCHEEIGHSRKDAIHGLAVIIAELRAEYDEVLKSEQAARNKKYRESHKSEELAYMKEWYEAHKSEVAAHGKEYRESHKSEVAARKKEYRESHKSEVAARHKDWREAHKSEVAARRKEYCETLTDGYVAELLRLPVAIIPPEMMEMKRNRVKLTRELVQLRDALKGE